MATIEGVIECWLILETAGLARPWPTEAAVEAAARTWAACLADVPDGRLGAMALAWLRSPDARYGRWPLPGALLAAMPDEDAVDDADQAWAEALGLIRLLGCERCPADVAELESLRERLTAAIREAEARDVLAAVASAERHRRMLARLPRADTQRTEALLGGVAACGGWRALGRCEEDALVAHRAAFRAAYRGYRARKRLTETEERVVALLDGPRLRLIH